MLKQSAKNDRELQRFAAEMNLRDVGRLPRNRAPGGQEPQEGVGPFNRVPRDYKPRRNRRSPWLDGN